ncbi:hypothetical protein X777_11761 [Ooceraea biroi]|uniref:Uncharacterized protein n=1 Tax=Ooceraea biroi TaxID=2015173 RepID=A0A026X0Q5_OOCBI|nr:hypothetical protein X777_11761 [Ooceraea biroi]
MSGAGVLHRRENDRVPTADPERPLILRHQTNAQSELFGRTCHNCRLPVYIIIACNMYPICTRIASIPSIEEDMEDL